VQDWAKILRNRNTTARLNTNLASALAHCLSLDAGGWNFRCVECHVATGTYPTGFGYGWHSHNEYQVEIAVAGAFEFTTAKSERIVLRPGRAIVIPWKMAHSWKCLKPGVMVGISLELLPTPESIQRDGWLIDGIRPVANPSIKLKVDDLIKAGLDLRHPSFRSKITASRMFLMLAAILEELLPRSEGGEDSTAQVAAETRGREVVGWIARHLDDNLGADISLTEIAREVGMSGRHVHRLFLRHVGKSLHDYLLERRLEKARALLSQKSRKLQVKEIAFMCGFNSVAYFSNSFRKAYGVAPSALLLEEVSLKSGFTVKTHSSPEEAPGPEARKSARASVKKSARG
jgi:AraC-like DNA-binding protein